MRWTPAAEWDRGDGAVRPEIVWAALDCPSAVGAAALVPGDPRPAVLAQLAASIERAPAIDEPHAVIAWPIGRDGRKRGRGRRSSTPTVRCAPVRGRCGSS